MQKISIITVCFNSKATIERTFISLLKQSYKNFEYIIIDGGSTDGTLELIEKYKDFFKKNNIDLKVISEKDKGIYDAMNKGIKNSNGQIIGILNSDDYYEIDTLKLISEVLKDKKNIIVHGNLKLTNGKIKKPKKLNPKFLINGMIFYHPTFFVSRDVYSRIGNFDINYKIAGDFEFTYRAFKQGVQFKYLNKTLSNFSLDGASYSKAKLGFKECKDVLLKNNENLLKVYYIYFYRIMKDNIFKILRS